jgi:hypothetical protein
MSKMDLGHTLSFIQWVPGALLPGVKQPEREGDHSPHLVLRLKCVELYFHFPMDLQVAVFN